MAKKLIIGNWKMNPVDLDEAKTIVKLVKKVSSSLKRTEVVACPPFIYIPLFSKSKNFSLGAQDANSETLGSLTGEVSHSMLYQFGVRFVIVGHSERRKMGENESEVNKKVKSVVNSGMTAVVCVGESVRDHHGDYLEFIKNQIHSSLNGISRKTLERVVIAYEPIWAIGASVAVHPNDLQEMSIYIKKVLKDLFGSFSEDVRVVYGGSVDSVNADSLVKDGNVSGLLVGRESLKPKTFTEIIKLVDDIKS